MIPPAFSKPENSNPLLSALPKAARKQPQFTSNGLPKSLHPGQPNFYWNFRQAPPTFLSMPIWFRNRPAERADPTEKRVAEMLDRLDDNWRIRWGYYYNPNHGRASSGEGDFVIQGPKGQILVMEVKGGRNRQFLLTGRWEGNEDGDNPLEQLNAEWSSILERVREASAEHGIPWVGRALCMPNLNRTGIERISSQFVGVDILTARELANFEDWWHHHLEIRENRCRNPERVFQSAIVPHLKPASLNLFIRETDRLFDRYRSSESEILDMLVENQQWIVEGGPGTGKTFLALQRAQQLAEGGDGGRRVLLLCYNLLLADQLTDLVSRLVLGRGEVVVKSWEQLVREIMAIKGLAHQPPQDRQERFAYFSEEVPFYVCEILSESPPEATFDALVIDEAQDHDTAFLGDQEGHPLGWWSWYFAQLKEGTASPVALFLDLAQRPGFRDPERFSLAQLWETLPSATHVRLRRVLRYTRQVHGFLSALPFPIAGQFASLSLPSDSLPEGPEVLLKSASEEELPSIIEEILATWLQAKLCKIHDVVLMGFHRSLASSTSLQGVNAIGPFPLADYRQDSPRDHLRYIGVHRAKGMDFLGVILIDMEDPRRLATTADTTGQEVFFHGATRARQLLGVVGKA